MFVGKTTRQIARIALYRKQNKWKMDVVKLEEEINLVLTTKILKRYYNDTSYSNIT